MSLAVVTIRRLLSIAVAVVLLAAGGCTPSNQARISGQVTLDGTPVEEGRIEFRPVDGNGPTAGAIITAGQYAVTTYPGRRRVEIHGRKKLGTRHYHENDPGSPMVDIVEETVPSNYNDKSELTADLEPGTKQLNFDLLSATKK